jgi:hypothetical protein
MNVQKGQSMDEDDVFKDPEIVGKTLAEHYLRHAFIRMKTRLHEVSEPVLWELGTIYEGVDDDRKPEAFAAPLRS